MSYKNKNKIYSEIDIKEFFHRLWAYKFIIAFFCICGLTFGVYLASKADIKFSSSVIFKYSQNNATNAYEDKFGALANIAGISAKGTNVLAVEEIKGRVFIEELDDRLDFKSDKYFNQYNATPQKTPVWKAFIKKVIRNEPNYFSPNELIWRSILNQYSQNVIFNISENDVITITVNHEDANRAAEISNGILDEIIFNAEEKYQFESNKKLTYLSNILADSLSELEMVQSKLKTFAVENTALPIENFTLKSFKLDTLRTQLNDTKELFIAVSELKKIIQNNSKNNQSYANLSDRFTIVNQLEFRRIFGQSENLASWSWPEISTVFAVLDTLSNRKKRLEAELATSTEFAERSANSLEVYAKLKRKEKLAEATYTVLIEQVKGQSMISDFKPENIKIYERASPSMIPSYPNRIFYIAVCFVLSFFVGCIISFIISDLKKVFYSRQTLVSAANADFSVKFKYFSLFPKLIYRQKYNFLSKSSMISLRDLNLEINRSKAKLIIISCLGSKIKSEKILNIISTYLQKEGLKIGVIDFSPKRKKQIDGPITKNIGLFNSYELVENIHTLYPSNGHIPMQILSKHNFSNDLRALEKHFDFILIAANNSEALSLLRAINIEEVFHIVLARLKHTKRSMLFKLQSIKRIQGLLYV